MVISPHYWGTNNKDLFLGAVNLYLIWQIRLLQHVLAITAIIKTSRGSGGSLRGTPEVKTGVGSHSNMRLTSRKQALLISLQDIIDYIYHVLALPPLSLKPDQNPVLKLDKLWIYAALFRTELCALIVYRNMNHQTASVIMAVITFGTQSDNLLYLQYNIAISLHFPLR